MRLAPLAALLALSFLPGCDTTAPPPRPAPEGVSPLALIRSPAHYRGKPVRCLLTPRGYRVVAEGLVWADGMPDLPDLLFRVADPPADDLSPLDVTGTCEGVVAGRVVVARCVVSIIPRRFPLPPAASGP